MPDGKQEAREQAAVLVSIGEDASPSKGSGWGMSVSMTTHTPLPPKLAGGINYEH